MTADTVPLPTRIRLIHGVLQRLADRAGADVLHVKGPAVAPELLDHVELFDTEGHAKVVAIPRSSSDADLLVRPLHINNFLNLARCFGWVVKNDFASGSAFGHAVNIYHPRLGNADIHRHFPGLSPDQGFDALWAERDTISLGNVTCAVPSLTGQRLVLLLHAARSGAHHPDVQRAWYRASDAEQKKVMTLAHQLNAEIAVAAALGELDKFTDHPDYLLWRYFSSGDDSRIAEWKARWAAARSRSERYQVLKNLLFFSPSVLESELGHTPSRKELVARHLQRWSTMLKELLDHNQKSRHDG